MTASGPLCGARIPGQACGGTSCARNIHVIALPFILFLCKLCPLLPRLFIHAPASQRGARAGGTVTDELQVGCGSSGGTGKRGGCNRGGAHVAPPPPLSTQPYAQRQLTTTNQSPCRHPFTSQSIEMVAAPIVPCVGDSITTEAIDTTLVAAWPLQDQACAEARECD